jgi:hypothetical protein
VIASGNYANFTDCKNLKISVTYPENLEPVNPLNALTKNVSELNNRIAELELIIERYELSKPFLHLESITP